MRRNNNTIVEMKSPTKSLLVIALLQSFTLLHSIISGVESFSPPLNTVTTQRGRIKRRTISTSSSFSLLVSSLSATKQTAIYDGSEWLSIQQQLKGENKLQKSTPCGYMNIVVGTTQDTNERVVGIIANNNNDDNGMEKIALSDNGVFVYEDSVAKISSSSSKKISDQQAIETMIAALGPIHCALPKIENIGGDEESGNMVSGKVVVVGGNDYACFAAEGLAALGSSVSLVSTDFPSIENLDVDLLSPEVEDDQGFCAAVGQFDSLVDTVGDERGPRIDREATVLKLLRERHQCNNYISTITKSQSIVGDGGLLFGPGKANSHVKEQQNVLSKKPQMFNEILPPKGFGNTVQTLFNNGVLYKEKNNKASGNGVALRGWSLAEFWEKASWPIDTNGGGTVRYGMPVKEDEDEFYEKALQREIMERKLELRRQAIKKAQEGGDDDDDDDNNNSNLNSDPYVKDIVGVDGLVSEVVTKKGNCVLFMSGRWCRTCKSLSPKYSRMARTKVEHDAHNPMDVYFTKAEATGKNGKLLARYLDVDAVPTFVLFKNGEQYGTPMSISKLPSAKLNEAIRLLEEGMDWDTSAIAKADKSEK